MITTVTKLDQLGLMRGQNFGTTIAKFWLKHIHPNLQVWAQLNAPNPGTPFLHGKNVRTGNLENPTAQCVQPPPPPGALRVPFPIGHAGVYLRSISNVSGCLWTLPVSAYFSCTVRGFSWTWIGFESTCNKNHCTALNSSPMSGTTKSAHCDSWRKDKDLAKESKSKSNTACHCAFMASIYIQKKSWSVVSLPISCQEGSPS